MLVQQIPVAGTFIEIYKFGNRKFAYPAFNTNYEMPWDEQNAKYSFRRLVSYIKTCFYFRNQINIIHEP